MAWSVRRNYPDASRPSFSTPSLLAVAAVVAAAGHLCSASSATRGLNHACVSDASCFIGPSPPRTAPSWSKRFSRRDTSSAGQCSAAEIFRSRWCDKGVAMVRRRGAKGTTFPVLRMSESSDQDVSLQHGTWVMGCCQGWLCPMRFVLAPRICSTCCCSFAFPFSSMILPVVPTGMTANITRNSAFQSSTT